MTSDIVYLRVGKRCPQCLVSWWQPVAVGYGDMLGKPRAGPFSIATNTLGLLAVTPQRSPLHVTQPSTPDLLDNVLFPE